MTVCVDSSIALKWVLMENGSEEAERLLARWLQERCEMVAPAHFFVEISSVLRQRTLRTGSDHLDPSEALDALLALLDANVTIRSSQAELHCRALSLAAELGLPTTYDAHYLALAESQGCDFWTADERLYRAVRERLPWVRILGESSSYPGKTIIDATSH